MRPKKSPKFVKYSCSFLFAIALYGQGLVASEIVAAVKTSGSPARGLKGAGGNGGDIDIRIGVQVETGDGRDGGLFASRRLSSGTYYFHTVQPIIVQPLVLEIEGEVTIFCRGAFAPEKIIGVFTGVTPSLRVFAGPGFHNLSVDFMDHSTNNVNGGDGGSFTFWTSQHAANFQMGVFISGLTTGLTASGGDGFKGGNGGRGGRITIVANEAEISGGFVSSGGRGSTISAYSGKDGGNGGDAGSILISARRIYSDAGLQILSSGGNGGDGGNPLLDPNPACGGKGGRSGNAGAGGAGGIVSLRFLEPPSPSSIIGHTNFTWASAAGGAGGWARDGGAGIPGCRTTNENRTISGKGGDGGDGGDGGNGGAPGQIVGWPAELADKATFPGGSGGGGGVGGRGGNAGDYGGNGGAGGNGGRAGNAGGLGETALASGGRGGGGGYASTIYGYVIGLDGTNGSGGIILTPTLPTPPEAPIGTEPSTKVELLDCYGIEPQSDLDMMVFLEHKSPTPSAFIPLEQRTRNAAVADGVTKLVVRARTASRCNVRFEIKDSPGGDMLSAVGSDTVSRTIDVQSQNPTEVSPIFESGEVAYAIYTVPDGLPPGKSNAAVTITVIFDPAGSSPKTNFLTFNLMRPPVLLVHGVWANPTSWSANNPEARAPEYKLPATYNLLRSTGFDVHLADYHENFEGSFESNKRVVADKNSEIVNNYRHRKIAASQVDVVGHSMGGILARYTTGIDGFKSAENYHKGSIRRLITVDTPHLGSRQAQLFSDLEKICPIRAAELRGIGYVISLGMDWDSPMDAGAPAIHDLTPGSPALRNMPSPRIPSFAICSNTRGENSYEWDNIWFALIILEIGNDKLRSCFSEMPYNFTSVAALIDSVFQGENDRVVELSSQKGGIAWPFFQVLQGPDHSEVTKDPNVAALIFSKLSLGKEGLNPNGFPAHPLIGLPGNSDNTTPAPSPLAPPIVSFQNPTNGAQMIEGDSLNLALIPDAGKTPAVVIVGTKTREHINFLVLTNAPFTNVITLPTGVLGEFTIVAWTRQTNGAPLSEPVLRTIKIAPKYPPSYLKIENAPIEMTCFGEQQQLRVYGAFPDNVERDTTAAATGTRYSSSNPGVVTVNSEGLLTAGTNGQATITAINSGKYASVTISVLLGRPQVYNARVDFIGSSNSVEVIGKNLGGATGLELVDLASGLIVSNAIVSNLRVSGNGTHLNADVFIPNGASMGSVILRIVTPVGTSPLIKTVGNRLNLTVAPTPKQLDRLSLTNGVFQFVIHGSAGSNIVVQASTNLFNWAAISTNTIPAEGWMAFSDLEAKLYPRRFFRVVPHTVTPPPPTKAIQQLNQMSISNGVARFSLNGPAGSNYVIQTSSNLINWITISTNTIAAVGSVVVTDTSARLYGQRFYRALPFLIVPPLSNDMFANRHSLAGTSNSTGGSNSGATKESGEPNHASMGGRSVWWDWTSPSNGVTTITTSGSSFDTLLAVYTGSELAFLVTVAENDEDPAGGSTSRVTFNAIAGVNYKIAVDGWLGATGNISLSLNLASPNVNQSNDLFANRIVITGTNAMGSNIGATRESGESYHWAGTGGKSVWWQWHAPISGYVTASTAGSSFDTILAVYTGNAVSSLNLVANNNDYSQQITSEVTFYAVAGMVYQIAVDGNGGASGVVQLWLHP